MCITVAEIVWLKGLFKELGISFARPDLLFCNNKVVIQIANNPVFHERTKHIKIDCHFIREKQLEGIVQPTYVSSKQQVADLLTKALGIQ